MTAAPVITSSLKFSLRIALGADAGKAWNFAQELVTVGRATTNDIVLGDDPKVSRNHAEFFVKDKKLWVRNLSSKNFILINGARLEEYQLKAGDTVMIGDTSLQIDSEKPSMALVVHEQKEDSIKPWAPAQKPALAQSQAQTPSTAFNFPPPGPPPARPRAAPQSGGDAGRLKFYLMIIVVGVGLYFFLQDGKSGRKRSEINIRTDGDVTRAIEESAVAVKELKKQQETSGQETIQFKSAQEQYIKGFRDYRQSQYARAIQSFQAALSFFPNHELAKKYLVLSQRKFDEQVGFNMAQGRKYYQRQNYGMCQSSFASVMVMLKDSSKPKYQEAKQLYDECKLRIEGRF